ncbi:hypothetical protein Vretifemale_429, partial [Volvox reticuliferus]
MCSNKPCVRREGGAVGGTAAVVTAAVELAEADLDPFITDAAAAAKLEAQGIAAADEKLRELLLPALTPPRGAVPRLALLHRRRPWSMQTDSVGGVLFFARALGSLTALMAESVLDRAGMLLVEVQ